MYANRQTNCRDPFACHKLRIGQNGLSFVRNTEIIQCRDFPYQDKKTDVLPSFCDANMDGEGEIVDGAVVNDVSILCIHYIPPHT